MQVRSLQVSPDKYMTLYKLFYKAPGTHVHGQPGFTHAQ